mmetsp:Transcript_52058/g.163471  ORF Transcript_52058/g.163471 Transcript_52058/m.163471 type:complete len:538 (+) Transcript_52058:1440-3053(+)
MIEAYRALIAWPRSPSKGSAASRRVSKVSGRIWSLDEGRDPVSYAVEIAFHEAPVRAAGVDAQGHLYTASRRLAKWMELPGFHWGDRVLQPQLFVREAFYLEVVFYFTNFLVFALQLLYFSCNRGVFRQDAGARTTVWPLAKLTAVSVFESWAFLPAVRPFWRTSVSLWVALMVLVCPSILRSYYDAQMRYEMDEHDHNNRNRQWWRKLRCYLFAFVLFGFLVIPTFKEFAVLLYCPVGADGVPRMAQDTETVCFVGLHLAMTVACVCVGGLYLACGLLFETVNFDLSSLLESKLGSVAAFPPHRAKPLIGEGTTHVSTRDISVRRLFYVMFRHLSPDTRLESPLVSTGAFTQTGWAAHSRHMRFISKVFLAVLDRVGSEWQLWQMAVVVGIAVLNLLVNWVLPPLASPRLKWGIVLVQASIAFASAIALFAMTGRGRETPPFVSAAVYMMAVILPFFMYAVGAPGLAALHRCTCRSTLRVSGVAVAPLPAHADSLDADQEAKVAQGQPTAAQRSSTRLAWEQMASNGAKPGGLGDQ